MPFAGMFGQDVMKNFTYCIQSMQTNFMGYLLQPLTFITDMLNKLFEEIKQALNGIREMINKIRLQIQAITEEIMGRIINVTIPLQQIIIGLKDILAKVQGTMTAGLFTLLGSYYTLKSLMGAIAQLIVTILIALAVMVAALWIVPFTWGAAAANTAIFIAISIPMALILTFMTKVLKVQSNLKIPKIKCFDKNTLLKTLHIYALMPNHRNSIEEILVKKLLTNANAAAIKNALNSYNFKNANRAALNNAFANRSIKGYSISG
jgi:hypothetical protein